MNKSIIIILGIVWLLCTIYHTLAKTYDYPFANAAMTGSWIASALLLVCIIIFVKKHRQK
jgi:hypothetical protein